jgi:hypothetical protein
MDGFAFVLWPNNHDGKNTNNNRLVNKKIVIARQNS